MFKPIDGNYRGQLAGNTQAKIAQELFLIQRLLPPGFEAKSLSRRTLTIVCPSSAGAYTLVQQQSRWLEKIVETVGEGRVEKIKTRLKID